jgi:hypothetical protein
MDQTVVPRGPEEPGTLSSAMDRWSIGSYPDGKTGNGADGFADRYDNAPDTLPEGPRPKLDGPVGSVEPGERTNDQPPGSAGR